MLCMYKSYFLQITIFISYKINFILKDLTEKNVNMHFIVKSFSERTFLKNFENTFTFLEKFKFISQLFNIEI